MNRTRIKILSGLVLLVSVVSCHNLDIEFEDYGKTTICFPYQTPARTLILGNYELGMNDNDNNHCFEAGVSLSGVVENKVDREVYFEVDESLLDGVTNVEALPANYYTIKTKSPVIVPKGSFKGRILVELTMDFFNDPKALASLNEVNYVLPLKITGVSKIDEIIAGKALVDNPNRLKAEDWEVLPMDYVLYGVKYINPYAGKWLKRGTDKVYDLTTDELIGETEYKGEYVERDEVVDITTLNYTTARLYNDIHRPGLPNAGQIELRLKFDETGKSCKVLDENDKEIGSGKYVDGGVPWGGKSHDAIFIEYKYEDMTNNERHEVSDQLVMRDRDVIFEQFTVQF